MDKESILGITPWIELTIRRAYYSENPLLKKMFQKIKSKEGNREPVDAVGDDSKWHNVKDYIKLLGIAPGDLLVVHSSAEELSRIGANPKEVLEFLTKLVGEDGTLAIPCFPLYDDKNFDTERNMHVYNPRRTICSTGLLPNLFIRTKGVVRSQFPWNSLAAKGPLAESMMLHNLESDLAHGRGSSWEYAMEHEAKILLLGVKSSHTTTMVHVAEDVLDEKWPINGWYEKKSFIIKNGTEEKQVNIRVRKQEWAKYNASWYRSAQFKKKNVLKEELVEGINVGFIEDSKKMVDYIIERTLKHKPFFVVPKRCYKNNEE